MTVTDENRDDATRERYRTGMKAQPGLPRSGGSRLRRGRAWCASGLIAVALGSILGSAVAQDVPPPGPLETLRVSVRDRDGKRVFDMRATLKRTTIGGGFVMAGDVRFGARLCEASYRLRFTYISNTGRERPYSYPARMRSGRLDGVATPCPFAGLPRRHLKSLSVRATIEGRPLLLFRASPPGHDGDPLGWLAFPELIFRRPNTPQGRFRALIRARYRSHSSHTVEFRADTDIALPPR